MTGLLGGDPGRQRKGFCSPGVIVGNLLELVTPVGSPVEGLLP